MNGSDVDDGRRGPGSEWESLPWHKWVGVARSIVDVDMSAPIVSTMVSITCPCLELGHHSSNIACAR